MATVFSTLHTAVPERSSPKLSRSGHAFGIAGAVLFHLILFIALLQYTPARRSLATVAPVIVSLISEPKPEVTPPPKPPALPKVRTQQLPPPVQKVVEPPPILSTAPTESPITIAPAPTVVPTPSAIFVPEPPPIIPPRFNADYLQNPAPPYPALARRMREQGRVLVRVLVSVDGLADRIELKTSSGSTRLDQSALDTIKGWKFVPARQGDQKVAAWVIVPINFTLEA